MDDRPATAEEQLAEARKAWWDMHRAEANLRRLNGYRRLTQAMRTDATTAARAATQARATLDRIFGAAHG